MAVRVAINGFGRTGRAAFRAAVESGADIDWVAINDVADPALLAHLLKYDTVYGPFAGKVEAAAGAIVVDGDAVVTPMEPDPALPALGRARRRRRDRVDGALPRPRRRREASRGRREEGDRLRSGQGAGRDGRARRQLRDVRPRAARHRLERVVHDELPRAGREGAARGGRHPPRPDDHGARLHGRPAAAGRAAQGLPPRPRRGREPRPDVDRRAKAIGLVIPELAGKLQGFAVRVPVPTGSLVDLTVEVERPTSVEEVNAVFAERADRGELAGILRYSEEPLVSSDIVKSPYSAIFDAPLTTVIDGTQVKVVAWYDNEWGYSNRLVELAQRVLAPVPAHV